MNAEDVILEVSHLEKSFWLSRRVKRYQFSGGKR